MTEYKSYVLMLKDALDCLRELSDEGHERKSDIDEIEWKLQEIIDKLDKEPIK